MARVLQQFRERRYRSVALNDLDMKLREYLPTRGGVFVEAGANDGISQSNTWFFERYRGWSGLLVEPVPELADKCRGNRPRAVVESVALVPFDYPGQTIEMRFCNLMSLVKGAMQSDEAELEHVRVGCEVQGITAREITVPVATLSSLFDRHHVEHVDLLSLDVEGYEAAALRGIDFKRHLPSMILVEARFRADVDDVLLQHYSVVAQLSHHDVLYRANEYRP